MTDTPRNGEAPGVSRTHLESGVKAFLARVVRETGVPGIAVAVRVCGRPLLAAAGGVGVDGPPISTEHRFHAGCTIKLLLAVVALELAARGHLELDAAIGESLPELRDTVHGETVRVSHLLSHTSGYRGTQLLDRDTRNLDWPALVAYLRAAPQLFLPGSVFSYEHTESVLLGRILERATGRNPLELAREMLLEPLGIVPGRVDTAHEDPLWAGRHDLDAASGRFLPIENAPPLSPFWNAAFSEFTLSTGDLAAVAAALLPDGAGALAESPVSAETRGRLRRPAVRLPPAFGGPVRELLPVAFGLGAAEFPGGVHGHNGLTLGQCVALRYLPAQQTAVAIGMNTMLPHLRDHVLDAICAAVSGRQIGAVSSPFDLELENLGGRYVGPGRGRITATYGAGRLELQIEQGEHRVPVELVVGDDRRPIVRSPLPQLSIGFFHTNAGDLGLMLGMNAYKRVSNETRSASSRSAAAAKIAQARS